jgi:hypothetical protein
MANKQQLIPVLPDGWTASLYRAYVRLQDAQGCERGTIPLPYEPKDPKWWQKKADDIVSERVRT